MSKQFALKEVLNYTVHKYSSTGVGDVLFSVDYATNATVTSSSERLDLRGGQGNYKLVSFDHTKDATFTATLPLVDVEILSSITGKNLTTGSVQVPKREVLYADASNTITLSQTPVAGTLKIYKLEGKRDLGEEQIEGDPSLNVNEYSISETTVTLNSTTAPEGTAFVVYYDYMSGANARQIKLTANDFPGYVRITGESVVVDEDTGQAIPITFDIKKAKVKPNFEFTMASDSATELTLEYDLYTVDDINGDKVYFETTQLVDEAQ